MFVTDLDDTLFKEIDYVKSCYRAIAAEVAVRNLLPLHETLKILEEAADTANGFDSLSAQLSVQHPGCGFGVDEMLNIYRYHTPDITLTEATRTTLDKIQQYGVTMALITDGRSATQREKIKALGLYRYFSPENIIISGETGADKTTATPFTLLMERNPKETAFTYLGDNPAKDFRWPNRLGWNTVQLMDNNGVNIHSQQIEVAPEFRAKHNIFSIEEILDYIH